VDARQKTTEDNIFPDDTNSSSPAVVMSPPDESDPKAILLERFSRLSKGDHDGLGNLLAETATYTILGNPEFSTVAGTIAGRQAILAAFATIAGRVLTEEFAILEIASDPPRFAVLWRARLRNRTSGVHVGFEGVTWVQMNETGEIIELTNAFDTAAFDRVMQLGDQTS
jgi:ketosteroid isomerase-like protein